MMIPLNIIDCLLCIRHHRGKNIQDTQKKYNILQDLVRVIRTFLEELVLICVHRWGGLGDMIDQNERKTF